MDCKYVWLWVYRIHYLNDWCTRCPPPICAEKMKLHTWIAVINWCIIYSLWCTSHEHLVLSHPKNISTPNTKYDIRWYIVQPISKHIPIHSLVSLSDLSIIFIFTWITPDGWALWLFYLITYSCPELRFGMHVLNCLVSKNQYLEQTYRKFDLLNKTCLIFFLNLMIREGAENTENQDFKSRNRGTQRLIS